MIRQPPLRPLFSLVILNLLTAGAMAGEQLSFPETRHGHLTVTWPEESEEKPWPILYWFHGTNGRPNPGLGQRLAHYVIIGMSYLKADEYEPGTYGKSHWELCLRARRELEERGHVFGRNLVSGFSKGGWMSFYIGSEAHEDLHGVAIFGGGRDPNARTPSDFKHRDFAVLVGTGETDANFPNAQMAWRYFRKAGVEHTSIKVGSYSNGAT
ncbi:MAG: hypothetical protein AAF514_15900 [Verrucomicrobiota bacterium]